jgi:GNAT superfamily N-acetyltransferase
LVAVDSRGHPIGAAWYRLFTTGDPGYGFIAAGIPEVTIAVVPAHQRKGVGTALLKALLALARNDGLAALSLSVEQDNPALELYERLGFVKAKRTDKAWTLQVNLTV